MLRASDADMIPRRFIHILPKRSRVPIVVTQNLKNIAARNPEWEQMIVYDDDVEELFAQYFSSQDWLRFNQIDKAYGPARADFLRYLLLFEFGGVYLDGKSGLAKPIDHILDPTDEFVISQWDTTQQSRFGRYLPAPEVSHIAGGEYQNWFIACAERHDLMAHVLSGIRENIDNYSVEKFGAGKPGVLKTTGPIAYTQSISQYIHDYPVRFLNCFQSGLLYSAMGDTDAHRYLFRMHYSFLNHPIIRPHSGRGMMRFELKKQSSKLHAWLRILNRKRRDAYRLSKSIAR